MKMLRLINSPTGLFYHKALTSLYLLLITACASTPTDKFDQFALSKGLTKSVVDTKHFSLTTYSRSSLLALRSKPVLNIYIGGDGTPWITPNHKSIDPTPRKHIELDLMILDQNPSIYIGRPCYHATTRQAACDSKWWTSHRYSKEIIAALLGAINSVRSVSQKLNIIGFSGGGSLAMLLAPKLTNSDGNTSVNSVVTISANLDIQHWTDRHDFTPLSGSLNPNRLDPLDSKIKQLHLLGELDENVDTAYLANKLNSHPSTTVQVFPNFSHHCCWQEIWPEFARNLK